MSLEGKSRDCEEESKALSRANSSMQISQLSQKLFSQMPAPFAGGMFTSSMHSASQLCLKSPLSLPNSPKQSVGIPCTFREQDILLGRGAQYSQNPGNRRFYEAIDTSIPYYDAAQTKHEKSGVVLSIFQLLSSENCRFLKKNDEDGTFSQIEDKDARQKISHALRYRKQNKSEPSLLSAAAMKKTRSDTQNATFPRVQSACARKDSLLVSSKTAKKREVTDSQVAIEAPLIFTDEELDSVAPNRNNDFPSTFASFKYYSEQDDELIDVIFAENEEGGDCFPW